MKSILLVEDRLEVRETLEDLLTSIFQLRLESADSAASALEKWNRENYDLVISDFDLPEISGLELLKMIRVRNEQIPFILFTGSRSVPGFPEADRKLFLIVNKNVIDLIATVRVLLDLP